MDDLHSTHRRLTRLAAWLGLAALVIGGGTLAGLQLAGSGGRAAAAGAMTAGSRAGRTSLAAAAGRAGAASRAGAAGRAGTVPGAGAAVSSLDSAAPLTVSSNPATAALAGRHFHALRRCLASARRLLASGHRRAARARLRMCIRHFPRLRLLLHAEHGQITFRTRDGKTRTIAFERGVVQSVSGRTFVVKAADGTTFTWHLVHRSIIVRAWHRVGPGKLAAGQHVFVAGPVIGGADDARLVLIRR
jgi:hypothetical protein